MDAGVPLATIQRWLEHHNISQTSTYLSASLSGDADEMRARTGWVVDWLGGKGSQVRIIPTNLSTKIFSGVLATRSRL